MMEHGEADVPPEPEPVAARGEVVRLALSVCVHQR